MEYGLWKRLWTCRKTDYVLMNECMTDKVKRKEIVSVSHTPSSKPYSVGHIRFYDSVCSVCYRSEERKYLKGFAVKRS